MTPILRAQDIRVVYRDHTLLKVSDLTLEEGEIFVTIGPNGAGKSTLLRVLAALQRPQQGRLSFRGEDISWRRALSYRRRIAVVLQDPLLLSMSVYRNVALGLYLRGRWGKSVRSQVEHWLTQFQVAHLAHRPAHTLSGGEAQRVTLARAFALEPNILFLDEPFSGLDMPTRLDILADLRRVIQETGCTTFLVTHDRDEALALADRVAVLFRGHIHQVGTVDQVFQHPKSEEIAAFVGVENRVPARIYTTENGRVYAQFPWGERIEAMGHLPVGTECLVCVRPEDIDLYPKTAPLKHQNTLQGFVVRSISLGTQVRVVVSTGGTHWHVLISRSAWRRLHLKEKTPVRLLIPPDAVHLLVREPP